MLVLELLSLACWSVNCQWIVLEIEGLCVGGYGVNGCSGVGYLLLMRGYKGAEMD